MKILIAVRPGSNFRALLPEDANFENMEIVITEFKLQNARSYLEKLDEMQPDVLITEDLAGFELETLAGNRTYNLLNCKQLHVVLHDDCHGQAALTEPLGINMFFVFGDGNIKAAFEKKYPRLPNTTLMTASNGLKSLPKLIEKAYSIRGDEEL